METVEKKTYETPEIQVIELDGKILLVTGSPDGRYTPTYADDLG